jgi:hypothetical protein
VKLFGERRQDQIEHATTLYRASLADAAAGRCCRDDREGIKGRGDRRAAATRG